MKTPKLFDEQDPPTELMKRFHEGMLGPRKLPPAGPARRPGGAVRAEAVAGAHYWAGFVLQVEWN